MRKAVHADEVLILGQRFAWDEKAPFVRSGKSVYGAVEYDGPNDRLRCHECGNYYGGLNLHIRRSHVGMTTISYREKHGLRLSSPLSSFSTREKKTTPKQIELLNRITPRNPPKGRPQTSRGKEEQRNMDGKCLAQIAFKLRVLAKKLGRTPTHSDLKENGIGDMDLVRAARSFGANSHSQALELIGLRPNKAGRNRPTLNSRMEWPEDYFLVEPRGGSQLLEAILKA